MGVRARRVLVSPKCLLHCCLSDVSSLSWSKRNGRHLKTFEKHAATNSRISIARPQERPALGLGPQVKTRCSASEGARRAPRAYILWAREESARQHRCRIPRRSYSWQEESARAGIRPEGRRGGRAVAPHPSARTVAKAFSKRDDSPPQATSRELADQQ